MSIQKVNYSTQSSIDPIRNRKRTIIGAAAGSAAGIAAAVGGIYIASKKGNPLQTLKNLSYAEKDVIAIGAGSIIGGLTGGLIADKNKENVKPKLREASQQFFGNLLFPIGFLAIGNKLLEKSKFTLPQLNPSNKAAKFINPVLKNIPKFITTVASIITGMEVGNSIMNKVNNKIFNEDKKHNVALSDYLIHADDLCFTANMLLKDTPSLSSVTSKVLPLTFILAGSKTGSQQKSL